MGSHSKTNRAVQRLRRLARRRREADPKKDPRGKDPRGKSDRSPSVTGQRPGTST